MKRTNKRNDKKREALMALKEYLRDWTKRMYEEANAAEEGNSVELGDNDEGM